MRTSDYLAKIISSTDRSHLDEALRLLRQGDLVCYPTDTVYGIGAAAGDDSAVRRLFAVKGRPLDKPLPLLIADAGDATRIAEVTPLARILMDRFWPGGLTIVMKKAAGFHSLALAGLETVALRVPNHPVVREIVRLLERPITGTSANRAGGPSPVSAAEVVSQLGDVVSLIIDGGAGRGRLESTLIDITPDLPRILREGVVDRAELERAIESGGSGKRGNEMPRLAELDR